MNKSNTLSLRVSDEFNEQLNELCDTWQMNKTQVIEKLVYGAYCTDTKIGKEQIRNVISQFQTLNESLQRLNKHE